MKYLTFTELRQKLGGRGRTTIYRDIEFERLPKPVKLGGRNYFDEDEVDKRMAELAEAQNEAA
jgi:prophage regulatory protein